MLGGGDDCALFSVPAGMQVATSIDMLLESRHFFPDADPFKLGVKALAVNLSDLAAMGATPLGCVLGLALPRINESWIQQFAEGFYSLCDQYSCPLIGGDTTRSENGIAISVTVFGAVEPRLAMLRSAAVAGDDIWVSGYLGAADIACRMLLGELPLDPALLSLTRQALEEPVPRVFLGQAIALHAHAAIDVSDGLLQDLGHILEASHCGAELLETALPVFEALQDLNIQTLRQAVLAGGDVYELCWTAPVSARAELLKIGQSLNIPVTRIGTVVQTAGLTVLDQAGRTISGLPGGFDHFRIKHE